MRCYLSSHDPIITIVYPPTEAVDMFGQDMLDEYGTDLPDDLAIEYTTAYNRVMALSMVIERIRAEQLAP